MPLNRRVVLLADRVQSYGEVNQFSDNLECVSEGYFESLYGGLQEVAPAVVHYSHPAQLMEHIREHRDDIVFTVWSGRRSRNRRGYVGSICEAYGIPYVGADPYVQLLTEDKSLTKHLCRKYGIDSAREVLVEGPDQLPQVDDLRFPLVVKPNAEGGSNGITKRSLVDSHDGAKQLATELLEHFHQPILVEEYIEGKEVCASIAGTPEHIDVLEADLLILNGKDYQSHDIYSCEPKKGEQGKVEMVRGTHLLTEQMKERFARLFKALGKVDVMRVDGRIGPDGFKLIELSPDCYMGADGSTALCFEWAGYSYPQMLDLLLQNALAEFEKRRSL